MRGLFVTLFVSVLKKEKRKKKKERKLAISCKHCTWEGGLAKMSFFGLEWHGHWRGVFFIFIFYFLFFYWVVVEINNSLCRLMTVGGCKGAIFNWGGGGGGSPFTPTCNFGWSPTIAQITPSHCAIVILALRPLNHQFCRSTLLLGWCHTCLSSDRSSLFCASWNAFV